MKKVTVVTKRATDTVKVKTADVVKVWSNCEISGNLVSPNGKEYGCVVNPPPHVISKIRFLVKAMAKQNERCLRLAQPDGLPDIVAVLHKNLVVIRMMHLDTGLCGFYTETPSDLVHLLKGKSIYEELTNQFAPAYDNAWRTMTLHAIFS